MDEASWHTRNASFWTPKPCETELSGLEAIDTQLDDQPTLRVGVLVVLLGVADVSPISL